MYSHDYNTRIRAKKKQNQMHYNTPTIRYDTIEEFDMDSKAEY